ncbi:MAG: ATP-binding protein [Acidimicrobiia bacterium]|nr:ATP-binding protein [Acidimicrobiia bacterium]
MDRLRSVPLFAGLDDDDLGRIAAETESVRLAEGDRLVEEGDSGRHAFVIVEGELEILKRSGEREVLLAVRRPGEVIGEMSLLEDAPRMASVRARTGAEVLAVPKDVFDDVLATSAGAVRSLFGALVSRWRETEARLRQREQLAQLGTLAAGLAHELNNPAAAAARAAAGFGGAAEALAGASARLARAADDGEAMREVAERIAAAESIRLSSLDRSDREDALVDRLSALGVDRPARVATSLAEIDPGEIDPLLEGSDDAGFTAAIAAGVAMREVRRLAATALDAAGRISDIVGAVKSHAFLDQAPLNEVDLHRGLDDTITLLAHELKGIEIVREYGEVPRFPAYGSELNQVWTNLVDNAADAVRAAGRDPGRITVRTSVEDGTVVVEIEDDGEGIPADVLPRVFESFFTTKPPGEGTGLGLDISYGIVAQRHGGDIGITSEPGRTTVRVELPLAGPE